MEDLKMLNINLSCKPNTQLYNIYLKDKIPDFAYSCSDIIIAFLFTIGRK